MTANFIPKSYCEGFQRAAANPHPHPHPLVIIIIIIIMMRIIMNHDDHDHHFITFCEEHMASVTCL